MSDDSSLGCANRFERCNGLRLAEFLRVTHFFSFPLGVRPDRDVKKDQGGNDTTRNPVHSTKTDRHGGDYRQL